LRRKESNWMKLAACFDNSRQILALSTPFRGIIRGLRTREKAILSRGNAARLLESLVKERTKRITSNNNSIPRPFESPGVGWMNLSSSST
jgi:hypothetical protein